MTEFEGLKQCRVKSLGLRAWGGGGGGPFSGPVRNDWPTACGSMLVGAEAGV